MCLTLGEHLEHYRARLAQAQQGLVQCAQQHQALLQEVCKLAGAIEALERLHVDRAAATPTGGA